MKEAKSEDKYERAERLKRKLMAGVMGFYLVNLSAFLAGMVAIKQLGNLKGLIVMLISIYGLNGVIIVYKLKFGIPK